MTAAAHADWLGWLAAALMLATFACREARCMRPLAVGTNLAFIGYGLTAGLAPVLALHAMLLPINLWRWWECTRLRTAHAAPAGTVGPHCASALPLRSGQPGIEAWSSASRPTFKETRR